MHPSYKDLACKRLHTRLLGYGQPEDYGYHFEEWISPYTKGAHALGGIALVLQDWSSDEKLREGVDPVVQRLGRTPTLKTNLVLNELLSRTLGVSIDCTYTTNIFPFIKLGGISSSIPMRHILQAATTFTKPELEIARPSTILALGRIPSIALTRVGVKCISLPHPAARIGSIEVHEKIWRDRLRK